MYIEQGYRGDLGLWKYLFLPLGFISLMAFNYIATLASPVPVEDMMADMIDTFGSNLVLIMMLLPLVLGLPVVLGWTRFIHPQSIRSLTTSRSRIDWSRALFAFLIWGGMVVLLTGIDIALSPQDYVWNLDWGKFLTLAVIGICLIPLQTSFEEYLFRAHMMQGLGIIFGRRWVPLMITSSLFGLMHIANPEVTKLGYGILVFYIGTGFFLGIITLMDEGLELALGFHAANNLITALLVTADWTAFQTDSIYKDISEPSMGWDAIVPLVVVYPLLLWIFSRKYGWMHWKDRLFGKVRPKEEALAAFKREIS